MTDFTIPAALQINMDDVGWWCGSDDRKIGGPSRTAMPRPHCVRDYQAIADLGKALNMKITCAMVIGEWDMDNRLANEVPYFSHYGENWNNSAYRDSDQMREAVEIMNNSSYIDIALHGLYHGYYMPGVDNPDISDFYYRIDNKYYVVPEDEIRNRLDHFFLLYEEHKMTTPVESFIPPSFVYRDFEISEILREYGIKYCEPIFNSTLSIGANNPELLESVFVENDIITVDRGFNPIPWDSVNSDFDAVADKPFGIMGIHWPNILNMDPEKHGDTLKKILPYFDRCSQTFGIVMSRNMAFAATQALYRKYTKLTKQENIIILDLNDIPKASGRLNSFFVSTKQKPKAFENCKLDEIQTKDGFENYEIIPNGNIIKIYF